MPELHVQYLVDEQGRRTSVLLPVEEFEGLLEDLRDLAGLAERRDESPIPHEEAVAELRKDGYL